MQAALASGLSGIEAALENAFAGEAAPDTGERQAFTGAVVRSLLDDYLPETHFGTLHQDLLAYAAATSDMLHHPPMRAILTATLAGIGETAKEAATTLALHLEGHGRAIVRRAERRGEIATDADSISIVDLVIGPVWLDGLLAGVRRSDAQLHDLADLAVRSAQAGLAGRYA